MTQVRIAFIYPGDVGGGDLKHVSGAGRLLKISRGSLSSLALR